MRVIAVLLLGALGARAQTADIFEAAKKGNTAQIEQYLAKGGDIEAQDREGRTPLMVAAQYGRTAMVSLLLERGANAGARDRHGWNAYMLALLAPSGGVVHSAHDAVLKVLPQPRRFRLAIEGSWSPGKGLYSSCFLRPADLTQHMRELRPDAIVIEALERFAQASGRDLIATVSADARGTSDIAGKSTPPDIDGVLALEVEPGMTCVRQADQVSLTIHATLTRSNAQQHGFEKTFGGGAGMKTGMRGEFATNANQHGPLYESWAKSQAGPIWWATLTALLMD